MKITKRKPNREYVSTLLGVLHILTNDTVEKRHLQSETDFRLKKFWKRPLNSSMTKFFKNGILWRCEPVYRNYATSFTEIFDIAICEYFSGFTNFIEYGSVHTYAIRELKSPEESVT
ncbi:hypothetical protein LOAG_06812 [Loa loa]|uniref:Uncharacterized protein n=1 Tax=Loa loa TaxID=7209 RepID=A0A1S0TX25_LOALO|nr:hypothetical protein LOAG_06812 [Loa loa]EFO21677.1 hypothetical protein LOAG_06812 [Loa loa]